MGKRCGRKGYFFIVDSLLALGVLMVGAFLIFSSFAKEPSKQEVEILSDDVLVFLADTKIQDVNDPYVGVGGTLWTNGDITDADNTLLQQAAIFYTDDPANPLLVPFFGSLTQNLVPPQFMMEIWMDGSLIYPAQPLAPEHTVSKAKTPVLLPSRKVVYGFTDKESGDLFGPYGVEVIVWKDTN